MTDLSLSALEELERLEKEATRGPWRWWTSNSWRRLRCDDAGLSLPIATPFTNRADHHPDLDISEQDMALIAALRNHAPALLTAARERDGLRKRVAELEAALSNVIVAWESLGKGHRPIREVERWLSDPMKPAMDRARAALGEPTDG